MLKLFIIVYLLDNEELQSISCCISGPPKSPGWWPSCQRNSNPHVNTLMTSLYKFIKLLLYIYLRDDKVIKQYGKSIILHDIVKW